MSDIYTSTCKAVLRSIQFRKNEYEGNQFAEIVGRFENLDGEDVGKTTTWFASLSEDLNSKGKAFCDYTIAALRTCGWTGDDLSELPQLADASMLANEVTLVREHKQAKDGKWYANVKYVNGGAGMKLDLKGNEMSEAEVVAFAKRMKSRLSGGRQGSTAPQQPARTAAPPQNRSAAPQGSMPFDERNPPPYDPGERGLHNDDIPF